MGKENPDIYFNRVYNETFSKLSRYVISKCGNILDSEDILQNIYARFYRRISKKGHDDIESAEAFLINIAKFECRNYFGSVKKHSGVSSFAEYTDEQMVEIEAEMSADQKKLEDVLCNELMARQIFEEIANEDEVTGKIFYLYFACDMKLDEVAKQLELPLSTVKTKLYRMVEKQKKKYKI